MVNTAESLGTKTATLEIKGLHVQVEGKDILKGIDLVVPQGEVHAIMGPNGSGKSTLANAIMGRPGYVIAGGQVLFKGQDITRLKPDQRAQLGLFLAFQYPTEIPGVSVVNFLRSAYNAVKGEQISALGAAGWSAVPSFEPGGVRFAGDHASAVLCAELHPATIGRRAREAVRRLRR